jgi:hypothetical protein
VDREVYVEGLGAVGVEGVGCWTEDESIVGTKHNVSSVTPYTWRDLCCEGRVERLRDFNETAEGRIRLSPCTKLLVQSGLSAFFHLPCILWRDAEAKISLLIMSLPVLEPEAARPSQEAGKLRPRLGYLVAAFIIIVSVPGYVVHPSHNSFD